MKKAFLGVVVSSITLASASSSAHEFERFFADGCCSETMVDCTARPGHPNAACQPGHRATSLSGHCFGVGCIGGGGGCEPDIATGSVSEQPNGIDDDCDGFVDDEQCDNFDNDNDGAIDEDPGSCLIKFFIVPLCWNGDQASFEAAATAQFNNFITATKLTGCTDNITVTFGRVSDQNLSCDAFNADDDCKGSGQSLRDQLGALPGVDLRNFNMTAAFTNRDVCGNIEGINFGNLLWSQDSYPIVLAHETGHALGLADEYCSQQAGTTETRCNTGSPPAPPPPNFLGADLGCDPNVGSCCSECKDYDICCSGNQNPLGGRCIMSYANADGPRAFCDRCSGHLTNPPNEKSATNPTGATPMRCSFTHLGQTPIWMGQFSMTQDGALNVYSSRLTVGRTDLQGATTVGKFGIELSTEAGTVLYSTHFDLSFDSADPKRTGVDYSNISYVRADRSLRAVLPQALLPDTKLRLRSFVGGTPRFTTTLNGSPPTADAGPDFTVECNDVLSARTNLDGTRSSDPDGDTLQYIWTGPVPAVPPDGATPNITVPIGATTFSLQVSDGQTSSNIDSITVTVVDTTAPALAETPAMTLTACESSGATFHLPVPQASDVCSPFVVSGRLIATNGTPLSTPVPVTNGTIALGIGRHTIEWQAVDQFGNRTTRLQTVDVLGSVYATNSLKLGVRAQVRAGSALGAVLNSGEASTELGAESRVESILSAASVTLRNKALVSGSIDTEGIVSAHQGASVGGLIREHQTLTFPPPPSSPFTFPESNAGPVNVEPGETRALTPGAYAAVSLKPRARLTLAPGAYTFESLSLGPDSVLALAPEPTQVSVRSSVAFRGNIETVNPAAFALRYAGTATAFLESAFEGRMVAPNALVTVSSTFAGELFAKDIELRPDTVIRCETRDANQLLHPLATNTAREADPAPAEARPKDAYGCACSAPGSPPSGRFAPWLGLSLLIALRRRRR